MSIAEHVRQNGIYLGHFTMNGETMDFIQAMKYSEYVKLGDVVYFMYVNDKIMKIGKASGKTGFYGRFMQYKQGRHADKTNRLIMNVMDSIGETEIHVYAYASPPKQIELVCPITGSIDIENISTASRQEKKLTKLYLTEHVDNTLPFCKQLK